MDVAGINAEVHSHARGEQQEPVFSQRTLRPQRGIYGQFNHVFLLKNGHAVLTLRDDVIELTGPSVVFIPPLPRFDLVIAAGSHSYLMGGSPELLVDAIGDKAESVLLRMFTERTAIVADFSTDNLGECEALAVALLSELADPERCSWMAISAYFRLILMAVWRSGGGDKIDEHGRGEITSILQSFRQLVEVHFREHWPIGDYAGELGITYDRLHAICMRTLGKSPLRLLHQRVLQEARLRLERSGNTIQEIADGLGFSDPTYFSHFFKRNTGHPPAKYRQVVRSQTDQLGEETSAGFADWP
jgi:AraC-like DNA-binding protein